MSIKRIAIAFSGEGSNMEVLIKKLHQKTFESSSIEVVAAITNKPQAKGIQKAKNLGIDVIIIDHSLYDSREAFDTKLVEEIKKLNVELVVLAGFMRILTPIFTSAIQSINIHPSLLPQFKGANALQRSFKSDENVVGVTTHYVVQEVDAGEIILQKSFDKRGMTFEEFQERIHSCEHQIFPQSVLKVIASSH